MLHKRIKHFFILIFFANCIQHTFAQEIRVIDNKGTVEKVNNNIVTSSELAPITPAPFKGDIWINNISIPNTIKIYNGATWEDITHTGSKGSVFFADTNGVPTEDNAQFFWDDTNNRLGVGTSSPTNKFHVAGAMRAQGILNSDGTVGEPSFRFKDDTNTGMYLPAADELGFSVGGIEAIKIDEPTLGNTVVIIKQALELEGQLLDSNGDSGTAGQTLTSTVTGTDWTSDINNWSLTGNSITSTNFIGTTNSQPFNIKVNNNSFGSFHPNGGINLGNTSVANENQAIAIGDAASANSNEAIAIGDSAKADFYQSIAIGVNSETGNNEAIAVGKDAKADGYQSIAIGINSETDNNDAIAIGNTAKANSYQSIAIGVNSETSDNQAIAIGNTAKASNQQAIAIGKDANVSGQNATGIGYQATTAQDNAIVLGSSANSNNKIGIGTNTPDERLHIVGSIKIVDTTEGEGKVLTSDASGKATWALAYNSVENELIFEGAGANINFYYVSMLIDNDWKVIKYDKTDVNVEDEASISNNAGQTTQPLTLIACESLTYN